MLTKKLADVFEDWIWSYFVRDTLQHVFGERLVEEYNGNQKMAYDCFMNDVSSRSKSQLRGEVFREVSPGFLNSLAGRHIEELRAISAPEDTEAWILLSHMCRSGGRRWARQTVSGDKSRFDIYKLPRSFILQSQWPENYMIYLTSYATVLFLILFIMFKSWADVFQKMSEVALAACQWARLLCVWK
jgi:hypothetical protein